MTHAKETGNATSQSYVAFFYSTGYREVVPVDQAKAQLYYTFAANGGDRGAQMALGYRYWSGIGTQQSCERASFWYESASEQGKQGPTAYPSRLIHPSAVITNFLSGPPGGRTLPHTSTRLSDLVGGIYGPGASVASTGFNGHRPAIKAGLALDAGETWEDVLEYYLVRDTSIPSLGSLHPNLSSSTRIAVKLNLLTDWGRFSIRAVSMAAQVV